MTSVSRKEGFRYGFYVFAHWLVLLGFSAVLVAAGGYIVEMQNLGDVGLNEDSALAVLGGFVTLLGVLVFGSGQVGLVYKVIADGVSVGNAGGHREGSGSVADSAGVPTEAGTRTDESGDTPTASAEATREALETATERGDEEGQTDRRTEEPKRPRQRPRRSVATGEQSSAGGQPTADTGEPTTGTGEPTPDTGETPPPGETSSRPRASSGGPAHERATDGEPSDAERAGRSGSESASDRRERPDESPGDAAPSGRTHTTPDERAEGTEQSPGGQENRQQTAEGGGADGDGTTGDDRDSAADVANESEIAEELGFEKRGDEASERRDRNSGGQAGGDAGVSQDDGADAGNGRETEADAGNGGETEADGDRAVEREVDGDASALDWGGSETTGGSSEAESADTGNGPSDGDEPETGSETGTGSLADALAGEDGVEDGPAGGETASGGGENTGDADDADNADDADDAESPRWTTGADHEGGPGQGTGEER